MSQYDTFGNISLYNGDALDILSTLPENSVDAVLTDPPVFIRWGKPERQAGRPCQ